MDTYNYSHSDQTTWQRFFTAIEATWARHGDLIHPYYLQHIHQLQRFHDHIPSLAEVNELLASVGWHAIYVDGLAPPWEIARLLEARVMPISRWMRSPSEVYFANGPDLIHDIFGHLPLLLSPEYRQLLAQWSHTASRLAISETDQTTYHLNKLIVQSQEEVETPAVAHLKTAAGALEAFIAEHPSPSLMFDKIYFWIFEFGIVRQAGQLKIIGAGLLSSLSEIEKIATGPVPTRSLDMASILSPYNISTLQEGYLVAADMQHCQTLLATSSANVTLH